MRENSEILGKYNSVPHNPQWSIEEGEFPKPKVPLITEPPYLVSPINETISIYCCPAACTRNPKCTKIRFSWLEVQGANAYEVQISDLSDFKQFYDNFPTSTCLVSKTVYSNSFEIDLAKDCCWLIYKSKIYWRVRAVIGNYRSKWSEIGTFDLVMGFCRSCFTFESSCSEEDVPCGLCESLCQSGQCGDCQVVCQSGQCGSCESPCELCESNCMSYDACSIYEGCTGCEYCMSCETCEVPEGCYYCDYCDVCEYAQGCGICQYDEGCQSCQELCEFCERLESCPICEVCETCDAYCQSYCQVCETDVCMGCEFSCQTSCERCETSCENCQRYCEILCQYCETACQNTCENFCETACQNNCEGACQERCEYNCQSNCENTSQCNQCPGCQFCEGVACQTTCEGTCLAVCQSCELNCQLICQYACQSTCETNACQSTQRPGLCGRCEFMNEIGCGYRIGKGGITGGCNGPCDDSDYVNCEARNLRNKYLVYFSRNRDKPLPGGWEEKEVPQTGVITVHPAWCQSIIDPDRIHYFGFLMYGWTENPELLFPFISADMFNDGYIWCIGFEIDKDGWRFFKSRIWKICDGDCSPVGTYLCYDPEDLEHGYYFAYVLEG